ncbi:MAG: hypothetical protein RLZZ383_619 [Pseudomonadota bacterium]|jgi:protein PhnA
MARRVKQRASVGVLGKDITRRARSVCELCGGRDSPRLFELAPFPSEPTPERTLLACARCRAWLEEDDAVDLDAAHFLGGAVWHALPAVRLAAGRLLHLVAKPPLWVMDAVEACGVDPVTLEFSAPAEEA